MTRLNQISKELTFQKGSVMLRIVQLMENNSQVILSNTNTPDVINNVFGIMKNNLF